MKPRFNAARRGLLVAAIGAAAFCMGGARGLVSRWGGARPLPDEDALAIFCAELSRSERIGVACLWALPAGERSRDRLTELLLGGRPNVADQGAPSDRLPRALRERSRADLADGRIAIVEGWILSLTETRLYAFAGLAAARS